VVAHDGVGRARHLSVASNGDVFVALNNSRSSRGGILALRDTNSDGKLDELARFGENGGTGIIRKGDDLWFATDVAVLRYTIPEGQVSPSGAPDTIVKGLPTGGHAAKSLALTSDGKLFVNIGSPSNSCQKEDRAKESPGQDPCAALATRAGIWRFDARKTGQTEKDGERYATGIRNAVAITLAPNGDLYAAQHGRDQLFQNWPEHYNEQQGAQQPSEEFIQVSQGDNFGWPYCYHDNSLNKMVLAPEYGGDGKKVGRCSDVKGPMTAFPGHWAPNGITFYTGSSFPEHYRGGVLIAWHGSWNRAPLPQAGYKVSFIPMENGKPSGPAETFADGFAGQAELTQPGDAAYRPMDVATAPDGSLYIIDSEKGRIWRVVYEGE
jgi:glucose/arabinose dehydrogenase